jgi:hypothetical protein
MSARRKHSRAARAAALIASHLGEYHAEAGIAAEHCFAPSFRETRWKEIADLYAMLEKVAPSSLHTMNCALAVAEWQGPAAALALLHKQHRFDLCRVRSASVRSAVLEVRSVTMPVIRLTQVIHRPVDEVFGVVVDVADFPRWNPTTKTARRLSEGKTGTLRARDRGVRQDPLRSSRSSSRTGA